MDIPIPRLPQPLTTVENFAAYARPLIADDETVSGIKIRKEQYRRADFFKMDMRKCALEACGFHQCCFEKASFIDVRFHNCNFSNCSFPGAYFERCQFTACKGIGMDLAGAAIKHTSFADCNLQYANFNTAKLAGVRFGRVDFTDASMAEAKLRQFVAGKSKFIRNDFRKTMLAGIDFTGSILSGPIVSSPPDELRGMVVDVFQAAALAGLLGIKIKQPE